MSSWNVAKKQRACRVLSVSEQQALLQDMYNLDTFRLYFRQFRVMSPEEIIVHEQARSRLRSEAEAASDFGTPQSSERVVSTAIVDSGPGQDSASVISAEGVRVLPISASENPNPEVTERALDISSDISCARVLTRINYEVICRKGKKITISEWCHLFSQLIELSNMDINDED